MTAFGIGTAVYLDRGPARAPSLALAPAPASSPAAAPFHDPVAAEAAVPARPDPAPSPLPPPAPASSPAALAALAPMAGPTQAAAARNVPTPPVASQSALIAPSATPGHDGLRAPQPAYWVEYGVYVGARYARRLQQALARDGIRAVVVETHGAAGRKLLRVRSAPLAGLAAARGAAAQAAAALRIVPLVHRGDPVTGAPTRRYWVQFGAFDHPAQAARLSHRLMHAGVAAHLTFARGKSGHGFYLVRSQLLASHAEAIALAARGGTAVRGATLIGETRQVAAYHRAARRAPRPLAELR